MIFSLFKKRKPKQEPKATSTATEKNVSINDIDSADILFSKLSHVSSQQEEKQLCIRITNLCNDGKIGIDHIKQNISQIERLLQISLLLNNTDAIQTLCPTADEALFLQFSLEGLTASSRKRAFDLLTQDESFEKLMSLSKGKDKSIYRAAQEKVAIEQQSQQDNKRIASEVLHTLDQLERLAHSTYAPQFEAKLDLLNQTWQQYTNNSDTRYTPNAEQRTKFEQAKLNCENTVFNHNEAIKRPEEKVEKQIEHHKAEEDLIKLNNEKEAQLIEQYTKACIRLISHQSDEIFNDLDALFNDPSAQDLSEGASKQLTRLQQFVESEKAQSRSINEFIDEHIHNSQATDELNHWFKALPRPIKESSNEHIVKAQHAINERKKAFKEQQAEQNAQIDELFSLFRRGFSAINNGQVRRSAGINKGIEEQLEKIDLNKAPNAVNKKLEEFKEKLIKLQDWHEYATEPKKVELIAKMEKLINCGLNPELLATKVKDLQRQWKQLSQGASNKHQALWEQFNEHAQKAYEPCKAYFDELGQLRQTNLNKRKEMVSELSAYIDAMNWSTADFKQVITLLRTAKEQWQSYSPVERSSNQEVQSKFNKCVKTIQKQLDSEFADNQSLKEALIEKAQAVLSMDNSKEAVEAIKTLQQQWKEIGLVERKTEQTLWENFRKHCDDVFEKRNIQSKEFKQQLQAHLTIANEICEKLETLIQAEPLDLIESDALQAQFKDVGMLPKPSIDKVQKRFRAAVDAILRA